MVHKLCNFSVGPSVPDTICLAGECGGIPMYLGKHIDLLWSIYDLDNCRVYLWFDPFVTYHVPRGSLYVLSHQLGLYLWAHRSGYHSIVSAPLQCIQPCPLSLALTSFTGLLLMSLLCLNAVLAWYSCLLKFFFMSALYVYINNTPWSLKQSK